MNAKDYHGWAKNYLAKFGIAGERGDEMVAAWFPDIAELGATVAELREAERRVALRPPRFQSEHYGELFGHLKSVIRERPNAKRTTYAGDPCDPMPAAEISRVLRERGLTKRRKASKK